MKVETARAVKVSYRGPSNVRGSRWIVSSPGWGRKTFDYDPSRNYYDDVTRVIVEYSKVNGIEPETIMVGQLKPDEFVGLIQGGTR